MRTTAAKGVTPMVKLARLAAVTAVLLLTTAVSAQTTYRWIDPKSGVTEISDLPPPPGTPGVIVSEGSSPGEAQQRLPYATRQANAKHSVTLYTSANCNPCANAKALLNQRS